MAGFPTKISIIDLEMKKIELMEQTLKSLSELKSYLEKVYGIKLSDVEFLEYRNKLIQFFSLLEDLDIKNKSENTRACWENRKNILEGGK